jgi:hypothetical protein
MPQKNNQKKTNAKRLGIKSVLIHGDDRLTITTFGKGNDAEVALTTDVKGNEIKDKLPTKVGGGQVHTIVPDIDVKGRDYQNNLLDVVLGNPAERAGEDYLKLKSQLEKEFFGKEFPRDNTRIQIIHNILDIQKILGLYIADIIYSVNNLQDSPEDIVGLSMSDKNIDDRLNRIVPYLGFFGDAFRVPPKIAKGVYEKLNKINEKEISLRDPSTPRFKQENIRLEINTLKKEFKEYEKYKKEYEKAVVVETYNKSVLRLLGACRQCTAHFKDENSIFFCKILKLKSFWKKCIKKPTGILSKNPTSSVRNPLTKSF